jgi:tight adherence protein B
MLLLAVIGLLLATLPLIAARVRAERRRRLIALQMRQGLESLVQALRVGNSFFQSLDRLSREADPPLALEWRRLAEALRVGTRAAEALADFQRRVPARCAAWFAASASVTLQSGGSLAGILENLAETLRQQEALEEKIAALTAQGKASAGVLSALPFVIIAALALVAPDLAKPLFVQSQGQALLGIVLMLVAAGGVVMWRIVAIGSAA